MRPHLLELTAFGPFAGSEAVDFDELADAGLFLLHGETGAGKTTLLDAICFALYGSVPGTRNRSPRLRSDHAPASVAPQVRLDFGVGERRWRITRRPTWRRPKRRGTGTTEEKASVLLERFAAGEWSAVSTRFDEVGEEIAQAVGMSAEQFCQVVLLPQGGFGRFLHAGVEERADLLQRLFGTERFERVERWLRRRTKDLDEQLRAEQQRIRMVQAQIRQVAGGTTRDEAATEQNTAEDLDQAAARALLAQAQVEHERARHATDAAHADLGQRKDEHAALAARTQRARDRDEASATLEALTADAPRIATLTAELDQARRATGIAPMVEAIRESEAALERASLDEAAAREVLVGRSLSGASDGAAELTAAADAAQQRVGSLEALRPAADELRASRAAAEKARTEAESHRSAVAKAQASLDELVELHVAATADVVGAGRATADLEVARATVKELARISRLLTERDDARASVAALTARHADAREQMQDARETFQERRESYLDGIAARLAAELTDDAPCPVCGGHDHPAPAAAKTEPVDDQQLAAAESAYETHRAASAELTSKLAAESQRLASISAELADNGHDSTNPATIDRQIRAAGTKLAELEAAAAGLPIAEATAAAVVAEQQATQADLGRHREALAAAENAAELHESRAEQLRRTFAKQLGEHGDLEAAIEKARADAGALTSAARCVAERVRAARSAVRAREAGERAAGQAGFVDLVAGAAAVRSPSVTKRLEAERSEHARALAAAQARLDDLEPDLADLADLGAAQTAAARAVAEADVTFKDTFARQTLAEATHNALVILVPQFEQLVADIGPRAAELDTVRGLADLAVGDGANHRRMALSSYVLAARLEEVAAAASDRLLRMTSGRYALLHTATAPDARRRWGLGLRVSDAWTGEEREASSLSGGETFLASLALALGLADVVTAEAGGSRIDTLFVDEGFGSLDENTLDDVLEVIDGLREGGRMVGLVSHVAELRQRIPTQLEVLKTPTGSTVHRPSVRAA